MNQSKPTVLLEYNLKQLKLPSMLREYTSLAAVCSKERADYPTYLLRLSERELLDRERRAAERRIKAAKFPVIKTLDSFDFTAQPSINESLVRQLAGGEYIDRRENVLLAGNSGTGKTHLATALGFTACAQGRRVRFFTVTGLVTYLLEAREDRQLQRILEQLGRHQLLILDELGYLPIDKNGADLLFQIISERYERGSIVITTNRVFKDWPQIFNNDSTLTSALLDRLLHHTEAVVIEGKSYRMKDQIES